MVARGAELERILSVLTTVMSGRGQCLMLVGEPGIGKTRLARESVAQAEALGAQSSVGRCFEQHATVPYLPFTEAFSSLLASSPPEWQAEVSSRWPELSYIIAEGGAPESSSGQVTQPQVFRAAAAFLQEQAHRKPVVLVLEDLHWADSTSLHLLLYLGRNLRDKRMLILGTYRDSMLGTQLALEEVIRELIRERVVEEVPLHRLSLESTRALLASRLAGGATSDDLVSNVHARAEGNPFFTEELLKAMVDRFAASPSSGDVAKVSAPRSIRAVVNERVRRLPLEGQDVIRFASVIGQEFDLDVLLGACGAQEVVDEALDALLSAGLILERRDSPGHYAFAHALIQETLYEELPLHRRRKLHLRVGHVLEQQQPKTAVAELARHFREAGDADRALAFSIAAGDDAAGRFAHAEGAHWYEVAIRLLQDRDELVQAAHIRCRLASELYDLNRLTEATSAYEAALEVLTRASDAQGQAQAQWGLGRVHQGRYDMALAIPHLDRAVQLWPADGEDRQLVQLLMDSSRAKAFGGESSASLQLAKRSLALAERVGDSGLVARALVGLTVADKSLTDRQQLPLLDRAEGLARAAADWRALSRVYINRANCSDHLGKHDDSAADHRRAIEAAERSGETERLAFAHTGLAWDCYAMGMWEQGRTAARAGLALDPHKQLSGFFGHAYLAWMEGHYLEAVNNWRILASDARQRGDRQGLVVGLGHVADFTLQLGRVSEPEAAREAAEIARVSWPENAGECAAIRAETLVRCNAQDAERSLNDADELIEKLEKPIAQPQLLRARGLLLLTRGAGAGAIETLEASAALARSQRSIIQLGRTLAVLSEAARQVGDHALDTKTVGELATIVEQIGPEVRGLTWARGVSGGRRGPAHSKDGGPLSTREREVAALIARGLTDRQIGDQLVISEGTAGVHVSHILAKLGFHKRTEIASWVL